MATRKPKRQNLAQHRAKLRSKQFDQKHALKHLPLTAQSERLIRKEGSAHVFIDEATMHAVVAAIMERGRPAGTLRGHERWGLWFDEPIGFRVDREGHRLPLCYGELKVRGDRYHVIPRAKPAE